MKLYNLLLQQIIVFLHTQISPIILKGDYNLVEVTKKQDKLTFTYRTEVNLHIFSEITLHPYDLSTEFSIGISFVLRC